MCRGAAVASAAAQTTPLASVKLESDILAEFHGDLASYGGIFDGDSDPAFAV